jgi:hypothetical protein
MSETPWLTQKAWAKNEITSDVRKEAWWLLGFAIFLLAISFPVTSELPKEIRQENYIALLVVMFPIGGVVLLSLSLGRWMQWWRFGNSPLVLDPFPASVGGQCGGDILLNMPYDKSQTFSLKLECIYSYVTRSGNKSTRKEEVRWYQEGFGFAHYAQNNKTSVRFCFDLPKDAPQTELKQRDHHYWLLRLATRSNGKSFDRKYRIPVFKTGAKPSIHNTYLAVEHEANDQRVDDRIRVLKLDDDGQDITIKHPYFRRLLERIGIFLFGSIFVASGTGVYIAGAPIIFPIFFIPIGAAFCIFAIYALINRYTVTVAPNSLTMERRILGLFGKTQSIAWSDIKRLEKSQASVWQGQQGNQKHYYTLKAVPNVGKPVVLIEKLEGKVAADSVLEQLEARLSKS